MLRDVLGQKVGMTQFFVEGADALPVTVINIAHWLVTQVSEQEIDGCGVLQVGLLRKKYRQAKFDSSWLKQKGQHFVVLKEVCVDKAALDSLKIGDQITAEHIAFAKGDVVQATSKSTGRGFQGVMKRWNFSGGPASHGSNFHRAPGSIANLRTQGTVIKGKKMPGRCGGKQVTVGGLQVVHIDNEHACIFVKGAVPGKSGSVVCLKKWRA